MLAIEDISNKLIFDLLTLRVVSESRVTWATSVPILVFLIGLSVLELGPMYATDRQIDVRHQTKASLNAPSIRGGGIVHYECLALLYAFGNLLLTHHCL